METLRVCVCAHLRLRARLEAAMSDPQPDDLAQLSRQAEDVLACLSEVVDILETGMPADPEDLPETFLQEFESLRLGVDGLCAQVQVLAARVHSQGLSTEAARGAVAEQCVRARQLAQAARSWLAGLRASASASDLRALGVNVKGTGVA